MQRPFPLTPEHGIELTFRFEGVQIITSTNMDPADEDLGHRLAATRHFNEFGTYFAATGIDFLEWYTLSLQKTLRPRAVSAPTPRENLHMLKRDACCRLSHINIISAMQSRNDLPK